MKSISVSDVRQRWPETEQSLKVEDEIVITRGGKPIARLLPVESESMPTLQFEPAEQAEWRERTLGVSAIFDSLNGLLADREDRDFA